MTRSDSTVLVTLTRLEKILDESHSTKMTRTHHWHLYPYGYMYSRLETPAIEEYARRIEVNDSEHQDRNQGGEARPTKIFATLKNVLDIV